MAFFRIVETLILLAYRFLAQIVTTVLVSSLFRAESSATDPELPNENQWIDFFGRHLLITHKNKIKWFLYSVYIKYIHTYINFISIRICK